MNFWKDIEKELESSRVYQTARTVGEYIDDQIHTQLHADRNPGQSQNRTNVPPPSGETPPYDQASPGTASRGPMPPPYAPPIYEAKARPVKPRKKRRTDPPEGMRAVREKSSVPFYTAGMVWVLYALLLPLYTWYQFLFAAAAAAVLGWLSSKVFRGKVTFVPLDPEPQRPEGPGVRTGDPEVDRMITEGYDYLRQLRIANDVIEDETLSAQMDRMEETCGKIFDFVAENPKKAGQIRRFMQYYLPVTLKLLNSYYKLSRQGIAGENISTTMFHIEGMMHTIMTAFDKQLDALFQDEALDISTDITVLEGMLRQEGLLDDEKKEEPHG